MCQNNDSTSKQIIICTIAPIKSAYNNNKALNAIRTSDFEQHTKHEYVNMNSHRLPWKCGWSKEFGLFIFFYIRFITKKNYNTKLSGTEMRPQHFHSSEYIYYQIFVLLILNWQEYSLISAYKVFFELTRKSVRNC